MMPNFQDGNYLIVDELSYKFSDFKRGDVIVFKYPKDETQRFIKRIIGLPGETVKIENNKITILNGTTEISLNEEYLPDNLETFGTIMTTVGENEYFVLGDNREYSYDSRIWGVVPAKDIIGRAFLRLYPVSTLSKISAPSY
jgi:signal peptidase I